jgi:methionyl-tRNA synthetase
MAKPDSLFPRIKVSKADTGQVKKKAKPFKPALKDTVTIEDFSKIDLRAGTVTAAQKIEKSDKLLKLTVDLGAETRQVIAGIAKDYTPESIIGKQIIVVANLKEATLMGEISQGMILAAGHKKKLVLSGFDDSVVPGSPVK